MSVIMAAYDFDPSVDTSVVMPKGAKVRSTQVIYGQSKLWAEVEQTNPDHAYALTVISTGDPVPVTNAQYLGTIGYGTDIWHVYLDSIGVLV